MFALKISATVISSHYLRFLTTIKEQYFPSSFKIARIKPLPKTRLSDKLSDFRPNSLLSALSKLLEKLLHRRMMNFIDQNDLLNSKHLDFCWNRCACMP